jgi:hypothetical protein
MHDRWRKKEEGAEGEEKNRITIIVLIYLNLY